MVVYTCNPSTRLAQAGRSQVQDWGGKNPWIGGPDMPSFSHQLNARIPGGSAPSLMSSSYWNLHGRIYSMAWKKSRQHRTRKVATRNITPVS